MRHKASCAVYDPCPSACDCGAPTDYQQGFQAGAASRDDEIAFLITRLSNRLTNLGKCEEERDQLRNQVAMLRHALIHTCSHTRIDSGFDRDLVDNALSET